MSEPAMSQPVVICPHCHQSVMHANFCPACGMALPSLVPAQPRVISRKVNAQTAVGQQLQSAELINSARQAARSLLTIGIINLAFGGMNLYLIPGLFNGAAGRFAPYYQAVTASMMVFGALYVGMYYWAKYMPLAAAISGLVAYIAKWVVDFLIQSRLNPAAGISQVGNYQVFRILMVVYLVRGVAAGLKHRKLERQQVQPEPMAVLPAE